GREGGGVSGRGGQRMDRLEQLGSTLVQAEVLTPDQWSAARADPSGRDLTGLVEYLARQPAWWATGPQRPPALNRYQRQQIEAWLRHGDLAVLGRALHLNNYLILAPLGEGGMGVVWKCRDLLRNRDVAVKQLRGGSEVLRKRLQREASALD